jgi:hypothetical protein
MSGAGEWDMRDTADSAPEDPIMGTGHILEEWEGDHCGEKQIGRIAISTWRKGYR